jgi:hypothetical protein
MKKYAFGLFALALAVGFSSFTSVRAIDTWFSYNLTTNSGFDVPSNYITNGATEPTNPSGLDEVVNAIKVEASSEVYPSNYAIVAFRNKPKVDVTGTGTINQDIQDAISAQTEQAQRVTLKPL